MERWLLLQLVRAGLAAWATASLLFLLSRLSAVGPEELVFSEPDNIHVGINLDAATSQQAARQDLHQRLGLNEPIFYVTRVGSTSADWRWHGTHNQYHRWLMGLLHGELGSSYRDGQPIGPRLRAAFAYTLPLTGTATVVATLSALGLGLVLAGGPTPGSLTGWRAGIQLLLTALQGLPLFALGLGLLFLFANPDALNILPAYSLPDSAAKFSLGMYALQFVLPLLALVLAALPDLTLPLVAALHYELQTNYATTARAKGVTISQLLRRHALPNALLPLLTSFAGLLPTLVAGAVVVEAVFALPGMGRLLAEAAAAHDYPVVVAGVLFTAATRLVALVLADVLYALADPRIRLVP